ncbi:hypothetical protein [Brachyspira hampsonii]|nr:hypothetical protein [Brachyspira hampsonii]
MAKDFNEVITAIVKSVAEVEAKLEEKQIKYSKKDIIKDTKKSSSNKKDD